MARQWFDTFIPQETKLADGLNQIEGSGYTVFNVFPRQFENGKPGFRVLYYKGDRPDKLSVLVTNPVTKVEVTNPVEQVTIKNPVNKIEVTNTVKTEVTNTGAILVDTSGKKTK